MSPRSGPGGPKSDPGEPKTAPRAARNAPRAPQDVQKEWKTCHHVWLCSRGGLREASGSNFGPMLTRFGVLRGPLRHDFSSMFRSFWAAVGCCSHCSVCARRAGPRRKNAKQDRRARLLQPPDKRSTQRDTRLQQLLFPTPLSVFSLGRFGAWGLRTYRPGSFGNRRCYSREPWQRLKEMKLCIFFVCFFQILKKMKI